MTRLLSPQYFNNIIYKFIYLKKFLYIIFLLSLSNNPRKYLYIKKKFIVIHLCLYIYLYNINIHKTLGYQKNFICNLQFISYIYII
jgi:hypothetical protein